jgi:predicted dehydrogenase
MDLCMIGVRGHSGYVFDSIADVPEVRIVGLAAGGAGCDDDLTSLQEPSLAHSPDVCTFDDWREMLDACNPTMLSIAGPLELNATICIEAIGRGIHVFCEKPIALTLDELGAIESAHAASDVHLAPMMGLRYEPTFCAAWQAIQDGMIGDVRLINTRKSYRLGERAEFYRHRDTYGGTIPWVGAHAVDWIHWLTDKPFESVVASHSRLANRGHDELEVSALCQFMLAGEVLASASIDYLRPAAAPSHGDDWFRVVGSEGVLEASGERLTLINDQGEQELPGACERRIFSDFAICVRDGREAMINASDAFAVTRACLLARQSADEGQMIRFPEQG